MAGAPPVVDQLVLEIYENTHPIWAEFDQEIKPENENENENLNANEFDPDFTAPGPLAISLAKLCSREGAIELDAELIKNFSEFTNYLLLLKRADQIIGFLLLECPEGDLDAKIWVGCVSISEKGKQFSRILIDQAKEIARKAGKLELHLDALTRKLGEKVYAPLGFTFNDKTGESMTISLLESEPEKKRKTRRKKRRNSTRKHNRYL